MSHLEAYLLVDFSASRGYGMNSASRTLFPLILSASSYVGLRHRGMAQILVHEAEAVLSHLLHFVLCSTPLFEYWLIASIFLALED